MLAKKLFVLTITLLLAGLIASPLMAQNIVSGDLTGIISDPSGAVLPNAQITVKSNANGQVRTGTANAQGVYRFSLLEPGGYTVSATAPGFQTVQRSTNVTIGQASTLNLQLGLSQSSQTVEVTAQAGTVETANPDISTSYTSEQISAVPNPGNDLSYIVQTAPGSVMNTQSGYGNSAVFGLPATSNLFTVNGQNENDPFLNLNNSGATNLLIGANDVQEATTVSNGYSGQYGQLAGANVNYVTRSGSNNFHGNAQYFWNGRALNANNWFNNFSGTPRSFVNANQWAASFGGPIVKDKTFFFVNTEGLRVVLPTSTATNIPSAQFQAATLANIGAVSPASLSFYQNMFNLYNSAAGAAGAQNILPQGTDASGNATGAGCGDFAGLGSASIPCALQFRSTAGNFNREWLLTARVDQNLGNNDRLFGHFRTDHGVQASFTDPISPLFNAESNQPQYEGQLNETHTFGSNSVNQFILSGSWYSAIFQPNNFAAAQAAMPFRVAFSGGAFASLGRALNIWPQGRNVTQYQVVDDFSTLKGAHNIKFGVNFRRYDITNYDPGAGFIGYSQATTLSNFFNGLAGTYTQSFPNRLSVPIALYGLGLYVQDEWAVRPSLKLTFSLRADHNSNPVCQTNCFARLSDSFTNVAHDVSIPYNQTIQSGLHEAFRDFTNIDWQPRFGFAWTPFGPARNTVIRGGFGLFGDQFPATAIDGFITNPPLSNTFTVTPGSATLAPGPNSAASIAASANAAFQNGFASGGTLASITAATGGLFVPPSLFNAARTMHSPRYQEWNLMVQQGFGQNTSVSLNYVGNHGIYEASQNAGVNGFCNPADILPFYPACSPTGFRGLPTAPPDLRFGTVTEVQSNAVSNYNGLTASFTRRFASLQLQANYTWSHALDEISNAGFLPFNANTNLSILNPIDPYNIRRFNYGNADYDVRHYFSLNYVYTTPHKTGWVGALTNWTVSGTLFTRTGYPFSAYDSSATGLLNGYNYGTSTGTNPQVLANYNGGPLNCDRDAVNTPCLSQTAFSSPLASATPGFGNQRRNQLYGPSFFNTDIGVTKNFPIPRWEGASFSIGAQAYNVLNHPNFDQPIGDVSDPQFGTIINTVNTPTSILGAFVGGDAAPRLIQVRAGLTF